MRHQLLAISPQSYSRHVLHANDRVWTETNCYVDLWIEVLHALGLEPLAAAAFALSTDFEGDQWTFFKFPPEDLRALYGLDVHEMNPWRPVVDHVVEQLDAGRLLTVEVNARYLPDTHGVSYGIADVKSTIVANLVDVDERRLGYFHNAGYFELQGDDFDGVFRLGAHADGLALPPYVELVRLDGLADRSRDELVACSRRLLVDHLNRRPHDNPVERLGARIHKDLDWLRATDLDDFHNWAFGTIRQCGASAELAGAYLSWLGERTSPGALADAAKHWTALAEAAKSLQFQLARVARGRSVDFDETLRTMALDWAQAQLAVAEWVGD